MANFNNIKHEIDQNVNTNGVQAITGAILNETLKDMIDEVDSKKQDTLVAGSGIAINGNVISATGGGGASYSAGYGINISNNIISADINEVQDKLVSGQNIKTINGQDILGTGDISIPEYVEGNGIDITNLGNVNQISVDPSDLAGNGLQNNGNGGLEIDPGVVATQNDLQGYLPLEGGVLQQDSGADTTLQVIDPDSEDYVKLVAPDAGDNPHIEIFENGSGDTKIYYDKIHSGNYDLNFPTLSQDETIATVSDLNTATSGLQPALTPGNGIDIDYQNEITVKAGSGLGFDANGYLINTGGGGGGTTYTAGNGIEIDQNDAINAKLGSGLQLDQNNNIEIDPSVVATQSDLSGYLPLMGGNLQSNYIATEVRVKSPSDDSYVYLKSTDTASPEIKFHRDIQNPTNGEVHEITLHEERLDIERWDQSGNTWMADTLYFPQFKTGTIALTTDLAGKQDTLTAGTGITIQNNVISATGGSSLWTSGTGTDSLVGPDGGTSSGSGSISLNGGATATNSTSMAGGYRSSATGWNGFAYGNIAQASADASISLGDHTKANVASGIALGQHAETGNKQAGSVALGKYNYVDTGNTPTQNTTFSIGNGTGTNARSNALELTAGDKFYMTGVGSYTGANASSATSVQDVINGKQDTLVSGTNIKTINGNSILGSGNLVISGGGGNYLPLTGGTLQEAPGNASTDLITNSPLTYATAAIVTVDLDPGNTAESKAELTLSDYDSSGNGHQATYTSTGISDSVYTLSFPTLSQDETIATISNLSGKQDTLTAGSGISIVNNVISATGGGGSGLWSSGTGTNSLLSPSAVASSATASGTGALNAGYYNGQSGSASFANGNYSANFGTNNKVSYANSFASGLGNTTGGHEAFVGGGASNNAHGDCSAVIGGTFGTANGDNSVVIASGANGTANGSHSVAIGNATASGYGAIAIGEESSTNANHAIAIAGADATGVNSVAIGKKVGTNNENEIGLGFANKVYTSGTGSIKSAFTVGNGTFSNGNYTYSNGLELKGNSDFYVYGVGGFDGTNSYNGNNSGNRAKTLQEVLNDKQDTLTAGTGISISGNVISATGGSGNYLPLTGGALCDDSDPSITQTSLDVWSPDQMAVGYIYSYSEDDSDPDNVIPPNVELGLQGVGSGGNDETDAVYLRSDGIVRINYTDSNGTQDMVDLEWPRKPSGQTYTIATLDDIQGGSGNYLPLTGGSLQQDPASYSSTQLLVESPNQYSTVAIESVDLDPGNTAESMAKITLSDYDDQNNQHSVVYYSTGIGTGNYKISFPTPTQNDTFALLSDIQGGGSSYTAGTGISISAQNVISNSAPDPGLWVAGTGSNSIKSISAMNAIGTNSVAIGYNAQARRVGSIAIGYDAATGQGSYGDYSVAIGSSVAGGDYSYTMGHNVQTYGDDSVVLGTYNKSYAQNSGTSDQIRFAIGNGTANNARSNAVEIKQNNDVYVVGVGGFDGTNAGSSGVQTLQTVIANAGGGGASLWTSGTGTDSVVAPGTVSAGLTGDAAGTGAVSCGYDSNANGDYSFASGGASTADGDYSFAANNGTATGDYSAAFNTSGANGDYSFAAGYGSIAGPDYSVALGGGNVIFDDSDPDNIIDAQYGVAIGDSSMAEGPHAAAISGGVSRGNYSFAASTGIAEGHYSTGLSGGEGNGEGSIASGFGSVAFGYSSAALGLELMTYDQADGTDPTDSNAGEAAFGRYNYSEQDIIFSIGCGHHEPPVDPSDGSDLGTDVRENAITITNDGKIYLKGLGGYTGTSVSGCTDLVSFLNNL